MFYNLSIFYKLIEFLFMSDRIDTTSKKRSYDEFLVDELIGRLRSKKDFYIYLDKHRK